MRVAIRITFAASKKEPLDVVIGRVHRAFLDAGLGEPAIQFNFADTPLSGLRSNVDRVLCRYPELQRFAIATSRPGIPDARRISNGSTSPAAGESAPFETLRAIAAGVPRSFAFRAVALHFHAPPFGELGIAGPRSLEITPGVLVSDTWSVSGRNRWMSASVIVEAEAGSKKLPPPPAAVAAALSACGKIRRTVQVPLAGDAGLSPALARMPGGVAGASPETAEAVQAVVLDYRARMQEVVERARLPHDLPPPESEESRDAGVVSGPRKPVLARTFKALGYTCRSESGTFTLQRRTAGNLTAELYLDVGTWSRSVSAMFRVAGLGFTARFPIQVCKQAVAQYPIGDADQWRKIVENLAALVAELDRSFVPDIEAAAGPSPEWYRAES
jgi:hypothetical protein